MNKTVVALSIVMFAAVVAPPVGAFDPSSVNSANYDEKFSADGSSGKEPDAVVLKLQIMLDRAHFSPGVRRLPYEVAETKVGQVMEFARQHQHPLPCAMEKN